MRYFLHYWIAVLALTKKQVLAAFYRFIWFSVGKNYCSAREGHGFCYDPDCKVMKEWLKKEKGDDVV